MVEQASQGGTVGIHGFTEYGMGCFGTELTLANSQIPTCSMTPLLWDGGKWKDGIVGGDKGSLTGQAKAACTKSKIRNSVTTSCQQAEDRPFRGSLCAQRSLGKQTL